MTGTGAPGAHQDPDTAETITIVIRSIGQTTADIDRAEYLHAKADGTLTDLLDMHTSSIDEQLYVLEPPALGGHLVDLVTGLRVPGGNPDPCPCQQLLALIHQRLVDGAAFPAVGLTAEPDHPR